MTDTSLHIVPPAGAPQHVPVYRHETMREQIGAQLLHIYDRLAGASSALHSNTLFIRVLFSPIVFALYIAMLLMMVGVILHVPSAQIFAHFQNLDPKKGYTVSYSEYQHRLKIAQTIVITATVIFVSFFYYFFVIPALGLYQTGE